MSKEDASRAYISKLNQSLRTRTDVQSKELRAPLSLLTCKGHRNGKEPLRKRRPQLSTGAIEGWKSKLYTSPYSERIASLLVDDEMAE